MKRISVIIPSFNSSTTIQHCLKAVLSQNVGEEFEVVVVDSSSDGTEKVIQESFPEVKLFHLKEKAIPGEARNIGAKQAKGDILAFTDSDCIPDESWLRGVVENFESGTQIVGGGVENGRPESLISRAEYYIEFREFSSNSPKREIRFLPSCNFSIQRAIFEQIGGFPDVRASEDALLAHQLTEKGFKIVFDPSVKVKHLNRNRWSPYLRNQYVLGKYAAIVRRIMPMPGGFFVKIPYAFPILPWIRTARTLRFIFQNSFKRVVQQFFEFLIIYPIFFVGSLVWSYGFYCGIKLSKNTKQT